MVQEEWAASGSQGSTSVELRFCLWLGGLNTDNYDNIEKENVGAYTNLSLCFSRDP